jgi:hypothetical protein
MMEGMLGKVMAGLLSLSAMVFSSYTANDPVFRPLQISKGKNYIIAKAKLDNAFDNDFTEVFKCGKPIHLWYKVDVKKGNTVVYSRNYSHTVTYDPMSAAWKVQFTENSQTEIYSSYDKLISAISEIILPIPVDKSWQTVEFKVESWLQPVIISRNEKQVDLMVLWKYKRPSVKTVLDVSQIS